MLGGYSCDAQRVDVLDMPDVLGHSTTKLLRLASLFLVIGAGKGQVV